MLGLAASPAAAQRQIENHVLVSSAMPPIRIAFDSTFTYVGTQSLVLFGGTDAEQHFFVDADGSRIGRMFWVQFEGKRPGNPSVYDYSRYPVMSIAGRPFHHDGRFFGVDIAGERPGSDFRGALEFLEQRGYRLGPEVMRQRLVWLLDRPARNELMIIYYEDLQNHGVRIADLEAGGRLADQWEQLAQRLLDRAIGSMTLSDF